jgi:hypothetical protein
MAFRAKERKKLSFRVKRSEIEESTHYMLAMQNNRAKILRLATLAQDDSLFFILVLRLIFDRLSYEVAAFALFR